MKLICIVAHPDDACIFCGGTIAKHTDMGDSARVVYMTDGKLGGSVELDEDVADVRQHEAEKAASEIGATAEFLSYDDGHLSEKSEIRFELVDVIRRVDPDLVLTHFKDDLHPDHRVTAELVTDAVNLASNRIPESNYPPSRPDNVYYFGTPQTGFTPTVVVDISDYQEKKLNAIQKHDSQIERFENRGISVMDQASAETKVLGRQSGIEYAEGFSSLRPTHLNILR